MSSKNQSSSSPSGRSLLTRVPFSRPLLITLFLYRSFIFRRALNAPSAHQAALPLEGR